MKRKIFLSNPAQKDIERMIQYIRLDKPMAAEKFKVLLKNKIKSLENFAERGRKVPELKGTLFENYRELIITPCRIIYKLHSKEVRILRVLHSKRIFSLFSTQGIT
ncbi:MAG: type II toxin-antitoxin system RelE/ParE family toxin [Deltaproteobacteria bacterium]|nr:type II toxin-antitoxin system RelE/ParE family toxin [Deltaproteobacteria bacterium]